MKVKEKIANYWYYYKWHTLIAVFFVVVLSILIAQMVTREDYDINILYAGPELISDNDSAELCSLASQIMPKDYDGDGTKRAALNHLLIMTDEQLQDAYDAGLSPYVLNNKKIRENRELLTSNAYAGDFLIYFLSEECYLPLKEAGAFVPLDDYGIKNGVRYDDYAVLLHTLDIAKFSTVLDKLPNDTVVCLRKVRLSSGGNSKQELMLEQHKEFMRAFTEFKLPEGFEN